MSNQRERPRLPATDEAPKPGDFEVGSLESRVAARTMLDDRPFEKSWRHMIAGEGLNGDQIRLYFGEDKWVLRTELFRGGQWVGVPKCPRPSRITAYHVLSGEVLLLGGDCPKARELLKSVSSLNQGKIT